VVAREAPVARLVQVVRLAPAARVARLGPLARLGAVARLAPAARVARVGSVPGAPRRPAVPLCRRARQAKGTRKVGGGTPVPGRPRVRVGHRQPVTVAGANRAILVVATRGFGRRSP
jgi:hypothetical protein